MHILSWKTLSLLSLGFALSAGFARANNYSVLFSNNNVTGDPVVGTGTFSFNGTYGDGTYLLSNLTSYNFNFTVDGFTFTNSSIDTVNLTDVEVVIYDGGTNFYFDTSCSTSGCYGPQGGSLDFTNASGNVLSTEPNYAGPAPLNEYYASASSSAPNSSFGYYGTSIPGATPEPEPFFLLGTGLLGLFLWRFRHA